MKKIVFNNKNKLKRLNEITHPVIINSIKKEISTIIKKHNKKNTIIKKINNNKLINKKIIKNKNYIGKKYYKNNEAKIIIDAPLLIEAKATELVDKLIVVKCSKKEQFKRILKKKKHSKKEIESIIKSQISLKEKIRKADFVVDNDGKIKKTEQQVMSIVDFLQKP